jgi:hypothetical protein
LSHVAWWLRISWGCFFGCIYHALIFLVLCNHLCLYPL